MKLRQNVRHFAARKALELPVVGDTVHDKLVDLHVRIFAGWADETHREEREPHLEAFFDGAIDMYLAALQEGYDEATAREMTHIVGTFDFYDHGWAEMMEFPPEEVQAHYERHREFFERHDISVVDPLGEFEPAGGLPDAPATPERLEEGEFPHATGGFADDVYVEDEAGDVQQGGREEPEDVDVSRAVGADVEQSNAKENE
ncbi:DUF6149 family protein [Halospeciosus flavus]|uniref:DUF6149 family protein n=1 Tax=Halospeciosus flavus TaxID=3032283 RepID=A0ABD5Z8N0_9EURY|nr:DUF6149 family protein [Halospeciosus flavus]